MTISNIVEKIKGTPVVVYQEGTKRTNLGDLDEILVKRAFEKICDSWNKSENSRKFIKHIISSFYPVKESQRVEAFKEEDVKNDKNRCCILGVKMAGVKEIGAKWMELGLENLFVKIKDKKILAKRNALPVEVRNATYAYSSKRSDKFMSGEAAQALAFFIKACLECGEYEVVEMFMPKDRRQGAKKGTGKKQQEGSNLGQFLDETTLAKLKGIKGA